MANTYTQLHIHCIFAVRFRDSVIKPEWQERLNQYITGIIQNNGHKLIAVNGMSDHLHVFFGFRPNQSLSDLMRMVKDESSEWINSQKLNTSVFRWQEGYGAFSYSRSQISSVARYIENQQEHHRRKTFVDEYKSFLNQFEIEYDDRYVFKELE